MQHMEDLSDREMERYLQENVAVKYFCGFSLTCKTPDHTLFSKMRYRITSVRHYILHNIEPSLR